jgi:hypothetical protein
MRNREILNMTAKMIQDVLIFSIQHDIPHILLLDDMQLPSFETEAHFWQTCEPVNHAVREHFNLKVFTIRCLQFDFADDQRHAIYSVLHRSGQPTIGNWVAISELQGHVKDLVQTALLSRPNQPKWYAFDEYQAILDAFPDATIEQVRTWERSAVWRIRQDNQTQYLKLMPTMFNYERSLTRWLAQEFPQLICMPEFVADNAMLTPEYQGQMLDHRVPVMASMLSNYAEIQVKTIDRLDDLTALGVPRRDMNWLEHISDQLIPDTDALKIGSNPLTDEEINQLRTLYPLLKPHIKNLHGFEALEHGDFYHGQVFVDDREQFTFTDFSDATVTHPFFSLEYFLWDVEDTALEQTTIHQHLTSAYLKPFTRILDEGACQKMMDSAKLVSALYSSARYYADILPQMAYPWEMNNMLAFNLRILLQSAQQQNIL